MSFTSFVYDLTEDIDSKQEIKAKCLVHFRPKQDWNGEGYGFDWMRIADTGIFGDRQSYEETVSKQHNKRTWELETDVNAYEGAFFPEGALYEKLKNDYNPLSIPWRRRQDSSGFEQYFCSWLSLYPAMEGDWVTEYRTNPPNPSPFTMLTPSKQKNTKAELRLFLDIDETPDSLEFEKSDYFDITPAKITSGLKRGKYFWEEGKTVTVECKLPLLSDKKIDVYAIKKNAVTGNDDRKLAGRLYIWSNYCVKRKKKGVVLVEVTTDILGREQNTGDITGEHSFIEKYFNQALITADIKTDSLDVRADANFRTGGRYVRGEFVAARYAKGVRTPPGYKPAHDYLYNKLKQKLAREGKSISLYNNHFIVFYLGENGGYYNGNGISVVSGYSGGDLIVLFAGKSDETSAHELYHSLNIQHSYTNFEANPNALYTYRAMSTENLMDYSHHIGQQRYALWHWQWVKANRNV